MTSWDECSYNKTLITCGRLPWLCNIYMGLALRDAVGSFCVSVYDLMLLYLKVLGCYPMSFSLLYICFSISVFLNVSQHIQRSQSGFSQVCLIVWGISFKC